MTEKREIRIAIRHHPETGSYNVSDIDVGPLLCGLVDEPSRLAGVPGDETDRIVLTVERTHEWELVIIIGVIAGTAFVEGFFDELGKRLADCAFDHVRDRARRWRSRDDDEKAILRIGTSETELSTGSPEEMAKEIAGALAKAKGRETSLDLLLPF